MANWIAGSYSDVKPRPSGFTLDLLTLPQATVQAALALTFGDRVTISGMPVQSPVATADLIVEGIKESQTHGSWALEFNTAPAALFHAMVLDHPVYGVCDTGAPVHY